MSVMTMPTTRDITDGALQPVTEAGRRFVALCEDHAADFAARADQHDREGSFPFENWDEMKASGVLGACVPTEFGGLGVESLHDVMVGTSRLARGDASTTIGAHMHYALALPFERLRREKFAEGDAEAAARIEGLLRLMPGSVLATPNTEPGNNILIRPRTTATPVDNGYVINGRKIFGTNTPVADIFAFWVTATPPSGGPECMSIAMAPRGAEGMTHLDDWDALGMRASGSNSIVFEDCFVPAEMVTLGEPIGAVGVDVLLALLSVSFPLVGTFIGIAEAARDHVVEQAATRRRLPSNLLLAERPGVQQLVAEMEVDLSAARAIIARAASLVDAYLGGRAGPDCDLDDVHALMKEFQCANVVVKRNAIAIVDRAMSALGGSSYMASSPLARLWRDVRAGPFMQPFSPVEVHDYVGRVVLGLDPITDT